MKGSKVLSCGVKWLAIVVATVVIVVIAAIGVCVWVLTPARLTPIVRDAATEALPSVELSVSRVELTFWRTFPRLYVDIDSLLVVNPNFVDKEGMKIFALDRLHGGINIPALLTGEFHVQDVELSGMRLNIVATSDSVSNLSPLLALGDNEAPASAGPLVLPVFSLNRFDVVDSLCVSYRNMADSLWLDLRLTPSRILTGMADGYDVDLRSNVSVGSALPLDIDGLAVGIDGRVVWSPMSPAQLELRDFCVNAGGIPSEFTTKVMFGDTLVVESATGTVGPVRIDAIRQLIAEGVCPELDKISTDMEVTATATLKAPYAVLPDTVTVPDVAGRIDIPECSFAYDRLRYDNVALEADFDVDGANPDRSVISVRRFKAKGRAMSASFAGNATRLLSDPVLDGKVMVDVAFDRLPSRLLDKLGMRASGNVALDASGRFRLSDVSRDNFYRADLKGRLTFDNLDVAVPDSGVTLFTRRAIFGLGTHTSYEGAERRVDSLLMASVNVDTISVVVPGMSLTASEVKGGFGCLNRPPSADTTVVIPLGVGMNVARLNIVSADSVRLGMRKASIMGRILRYEGNLHAPRFRMDASAGAIMATDGHSFVGLQNGEISVDSHMRIKKPRLGGDSARRRIGRRVSVDTTGNMEFVDSGLLKIFNRWQLTGHVVAEKGMMFSPLMPIRNRLSGLDMTFSTDSVVLRSLKYNGGRSDFSVRGTITNLRRALNRRGDLTIRCNVSSDTLDLDQLLRVAAMGSAYAESHGGATLMGDLDEIAAVTADDVDASVPLTAILVPTNIDADLDVSARNVVYSQMPVRDFSGCLMVKGGAVSLRDLNASSDIGTLNMSALYSAPEKNDIRFGFGLQLNRIDVSQFVNLMPAIDSIMPLLGSFRGVIDADIAATADLDSLMNIKLPTLDAVVRLSGDSLGLLDAETFRTLKKWLRFKGSDNNQIEHMDVEMLVRNSTMEIFPFVFNFDRYRLAVMGSNDLDLNFKYHISVLKSPLPFKFGINLSGNPDDMKVRFGGAKYKEGMAGQSVALVDTTRVNLLNEMQRIFNAGVARRRLGPLRVNRSPVAVDSDDAISHADSLMMIREGLIDAPDTLSGPQVNNEKKRK